jgi:hypothetical protein
MERNNAMKRIETRCDNIEWDKILQEVQTKLNYLRLVWKISERDCNPELHRKMVEDLYVPALEKLAEFCLCIQDDGVSGETWVESKAKWLTL